MSDEQTYCVAAKKILKEVDLRWNSLLDPIIRKKSDLQTAILEKVYDGEPSPQTFLNHANRDDRRYYLTESQARGLAKLFRQEQNWLRFIHDLHPLDYREDVLVHRVPGRAEILCERFSTDNLLKDTKIAGYVQLFVDDVQFRKEQDDGSVIVDGGSYVRIVPTAKSDGAITLIADADPKKPRLLLISEYRHNAQAYLVEACRGFGSHEDKDEKETGRRERWEETWIPDSWVVKHERIGSAFTDSGKLRERPTYFLEFVCLPEDKDDYIAGLRPVMTDPVWVPLKKFYKAIFANQGGKPLTLGGKEFHFYLHKEQRAELNTLAPINQGKLLIEDNFTIACALLALPHLAKHYRLTVSDILGI